MKAFFKFLFIQLKMDLRSRGTLMNYYVIPILFYLVVGSVFAHTSPTTKLTLPATMIIFAIAMGTSIGVPGPIVSMREAGILRAFRVNGISNGTVMLVHGVSAFLHVLLASLIIYFSAPHIFSSSYPSQPLWFFLILFIFLMVSTIVGILIGVCAPNQSYSTILSQVIFLPSLLLSGIMVAASQLPTVLMWVGRILPATYAMQLFTGLSYRLKTDISTPVSMIVLCGMGIATLVAAFIRVHSITDKAES